MFRMVRVTYAEANYFLYFILLRLSCCLWQDPHWRMLLWRCVDNGSYQGCPLPERQDSLQDYPAEDSYSAGYEGEQLTDDLNEWHLGNDKPWVSDEVAPEVQKPSVDESEWSDGWK